MAGHGGRRLRQAGTALLLWYAAALVLPAGLIAATSSSTPVGGGGRVDSCTGGINCLLDAPDGGDVFRLAAGFLALSLVIAVPLCAYLLRSWKLPVLAATVATFSAWFLTPMIWCGGLALLAR